MATYSTLLWQGVGPTSNSTIFTVPASDTCVLRCVTVFNASGSSPQWNMTSIVPGLANSVPLASPASGDARFQTWEGRVVLPPGSVLELSVTVANVYFTVSGYLLAN